MVDGNENEKTIKGTENEVNWTRNDLVFSEISKV